MLAALLTVAAAAREKHPFVQAHNGEVVRLAVVPQREFIVTAGADGLVKLWTFPDLAPSRSLMGFDRGVTGMAMSHDGFRVVASDARSHMGIVTLWGTEAKNPPITRTLEKDEVATDLLLTPDDKRILGLMLNLAQTGPAVRTFDGRSIADDRWFEAKLAPGANAVALDATGELLSATCDTGNVVRWKLPQSMPARYPAVSKRPVAVASSPDGKNVYFGDEDGNLFAITEARKDPVKLWSIGAPVSSIAVDAKGEWIAIATSARSRREVYRRTALGKPYAVPSGPGMPIRVLPVAVFLSGSGAGAPPDGKTVTIAGPVGGSLCVTFSEDGKHLAAGGNDGVLHAWWIVEDKARVTR